MVERYATKAAPLTTNVMHWIKKLFGFVSLPDVDLSNSWEVSEMSDPVKFMDFILSQATPEDEWKIEMVFTKQTLAALRQFAPEGAPITLIPETVSALRSLLPSFDFNSDFIHHTVARGDEFLMVSYDNLSCCWVSKRVSEDQMQAAARQCGFEFEDTGDA